MTNSISFIRQRRALIGTFSAGYLVTAAASLLLQSEAVAASGGRAALLILLGIGSLITVTLGIAMSILYVRSRRSPHHNAVQDASHSTSSMMFGYLAMLLGFVTVTPIAVFVELPTVMVLLGLLAFGVLVQMVSFLVLEGLTSRKVNCAV